MKITKRTQPDEFETLAKIVQIKEDSQHFAKLEERITTTVSKEQLETLYHVDGLVFRAVNDYVDKVIRPGYYLEGKKNLVKVSEEWLENIRFIPLIEEVFKDNFISGAGNGWCELGYSADGEDIPSVRILNPKYMDYIREDAAQSKNVKLDPRGDPLGIRQAKSDYRNETLWTENQITSDGNITWVAQEGEDGRDRVAHFKLFGLGESFLGNSPVEAVYKQAVIRLNLEDNVGGIVHQSGGIIVTLGSPDPNRPLQITDEQINSVVDQLQSVNKQSIFGFRQGTKIERFPSPDLRDRLGLLTYFASVQNIGLGIPPSRYNISAGSNRSYSSSKDESDIDFEQRVISLQSRLAEQAREKLLYKMLKARKLITSYSEVPKINFRINTSSMLSQQMDIVSKLSRRDMVRRDPELEKYIREELGLPTKYLNREIDLWDKDKTMIPSEAVKGGNKNIDTIPKEEPIKPDEENPKDKEEPKDKEKEE